jgi:hypothetical protein
MRLSYCSLPLMLAVLVGCGDGRVKLPTAPVTGSVAYQGKPVSAARIIFVHSSGQAAAADLAADGTFKLTAFQGQCQVAIQCLESNTSAGHSVTKGSAGKLPGRPLFPARYSEYATSGLTFEVKAGENKANLALTD